MFSIKQPRNSFTSYLNSSTWIYTGKEWQNQCVSPFTFNIFTLVAPSVSRSRSATSGSISFACSHYDSSMDYFGHISELGNPSAATKFNCETSGCRCNANGLQPDRAYLISLEACMLKTPFLCSEKSNPVSLHTRPDRELFNCKCYIVIRGMDSSVLVNESFI